MRNKGKTLKQLLPLPGSSSLPPSPHSSPPMSDTEGDGSLGGQYAAVSLCHSFLLCFSSALASVPHWAQLEPAMSSPGQHLASSYRSHPCLLPSVNTWVMSPNIQLHSKDASERVFYQDSLHHTGAMFPVPGYGYFRTDSSFQWMESQNGRRSALPVMKRHHTDDQLLFLFSCLLLRIILQLWISLCTYCVEFYSDVSKI